MFSGLYAARKKSKEEVRWTSGQWACGTGGEHSGAPALVHLTVSLRKPHVVGAQVQALFEAPFHISSLKLVAVLSAAAEASEGGEAPWVLGGAFCLGGLPWMGQQVAPRPWGWRGAQEETGRQGQWSPRLQGHHQALRPGRPGGGSPADCPAAGPSPSEVAGQALWMPKGLEVRPQEP